MVENEVGSGKVIVALVTESDLRWECHGNIRAYSGDTTDVPSERYPRVTNVSDAIA